MFLNWFVGPDKAHNAKSSNELIDKHDLNPMPETITSAVTEDDVLRNLPKFEKYFTANAWSCVTELSRIKLY